MQEIDKIYSNLLMITEIDGYSKISYKWLPIKKYMTYMYAELDFIWFLNLNHIL